VATHSRRVVEKLTAHAEVDVIVPVEEDGLEYDRSLEPEIRLWTAEEFDWSDGLRGYDRVLYTLGGSPFHVHAFEALMKRPGAVLAHDVFLVGLYAAIAERQVPWDPSWLERKLGELYGERLTVWDRRRIWEPGVYEDKEVFMTQEIQRRAEQVIVHSDYQRDILRLEAPRGAAATHVAPLGVPDAPEPVAPATGGAGPVIVTLGLVSVDAKRMPLLLGGFAKLRATSPDARLLVVGKLIDSERERLVSLIADLGLGDSVELRGRVSRDEYWETLRAADLAVQLRAGVKGPSAAVCDCIAARVPTIASSIGSLREVPSPVVLPVPEDCSPRLLAERMASALGDQRLREDIRIAQDAYAEANSFTRVAERYAELLAL
jgi:glycosyltransferase involved in cell wall biosynthesis